MQPSRHAVPERAEVLRISAAEILRRAYVLRRPKLDEEIVRLRAEEWAITVNSRFADDPRLVNVEVLERVIHYTVSLLVAVVMAVGAARSALRHFVCE